MKFIAILIQVCTVLSLAACGGSHLSVDLPEGQGKALELYFPPGRAVEHRLPRIADGIPPYESSIEGCPDWVTLSPDQGILAGAAPIAENDKTLFCTYSVTESDPGFRPARTVTYGLRLTVGPLDRGKWRFRTRTIEPGGPCALPLPGRSTPVAILPHAQGEDVDQATYELLDRPNDGILTFDPGTRQLTHPHTSAAPILGTPNTYRYLVGTARVDAANAEDALCLDIQYNPGTGICPGESPERYIHIQLQVRDDVYWDEGRGEYRCPDRPPESIPSSGSATSIPFTRRSRRFMRGAPPMSLIAAFAIGFAAGRPGLRACSPPSPLPLVSPHYRDGAKGSTTRARAGR